MVEPILDNDSFRFIEDDNEFQSYLCKSKTLSEYSPSGIISVERIMMFNLIINYVNKWDFQKHYKYKI